jgi:hypothetical protein
MLGFNLLYLINTCYAMGGLVDYCHVPGAAIEPGMGKPLFAASYPTLIGFGFTDANNNYINLSDTSPAGLAAWNKSITSAAEYRPAPGGITDIFGFFSWVVTGMRLIVNIFITPFYDLPMWVSQNFGIIPILTMPFGVALGVLQMIGLFQWATTRPGIGR